MRYLTQDQRVERSYRWTRRLVVAGFVLIALCCGLLGRVAMAEAKTTIIAPPDAHYPYQQWVDEAKVPTPDVTLSIIEDNGPCLSPSDYAYACTGADTYTIWDISSDREAFLHELGHNFDYYQLPAWVRQRFLLLTEDTRPWEADPNGANEHFATAFARCAATGSRFHGNPFLQIKGSGGGIRQITYRAICRMIINVGT